MAQVYAEPWKVLPRKVGGLSHNRPAQQPHTQTETAHRYAHVRAQTQNILYTHVHRINRHNNNNGSQHFLSTY